MRIARQFEGGEQVDLEDLPPLVLGVFGRGPGEVAAGIVDQDVQAVALVFHPVEQFAPLFVLGDVGDEDLHVALREVLRQFRARGLEPGGVARGQQHVGAESQQLARDRAADAGAAAGHQRQLSVEPPAPGVHAASFVPSPA